MGMIEVEMMLNSNTLADAQPSLRLDSGFLDGKARAYTRIGDDNLPKNIKIVIAVGYSYALLEIGFLKLWPPNDYQL